MGNHIDKLGDYDSVLVIPSLSFVADEGFSLAKKEGVRSPSLSQIKSA